MTIHKNIELFKDFHMRQTTDIKVDVEIQEKPNGNKVRFSTDNVFNKLEGSDKTRFSNLEYFGGNHIEHYYGKRLEGEMYFFVLPCGQ